MIILDAEMKCCAVMKSAHVLFSMPITISSLLTMESEAASLEIDSRNVGARLQIFEEKRYLLENMKKSAFTLGTSGITYVLDSNYYN